MFFKLSFYNIIYKILISITILLYNKNLYFLFFKKQILNNKLIKIKKNINNNSM